MIIDFHTHTFPDKIAQKTISYLAAKGNITPYSDGTLGGLKQSMKRAGIDYSVVLPVATSPKQVPTINALSRELSGKDGIFFAGCIHPDCDNIEDILDDIKDAGLFGIKLHPDYQGVYFDDDRYIRIIEGAAKRNLITVTHAGFDVGFPDEDIRCTPDRIVRVLDTLKGVIEDKIVLAHLGNFQAPEEVLEKLAGRPVYMDTAVVLDRYTPSVTKKIIEAHGYDRVLFASDSPWGDQKKFVEIFRSLGFSKEAQDKMFFKNACRLLNL